MPDFPRDYFAVSCVRKDKQPDENYVYNEFSDAKHHFDSFRNDDSGLYDKIELLTCLEDSSITVCDVIEF